MKKLTLIFALGLGLSTVALAGAPKTNEVKSDAKSDSKTTSKTSDDATAWYQYNGPQPGTTGQLNNPANYGTTPVDEETLCPSSGPNRCAAEFTQDAMGHPTGTPVDFLTKPI